MFSSPFQEFVFIICCFIMPLAVMMPAFVVFFLTKKLDTKKRYLINSILIAFLVPFLNLIYFVFVFWDDSMIAGIIGAVWLFIILPICLLISIIGFSIKDKRAKYLLLTTVLMYLFGVIFIFVGYKYALSYYLYKENQILAKYDVLFDKLEDYKKQNNIYPKDIDNFDIPTKYYDYFYETKDNGKDFIFTVRKSEYSNSFAYCSNSKYPKCHTEPENSRYFAKRGKWIQEFYLD